MRNDIRVGELQVKENIRLSEGQEIKLLPGKDGIAVIQKDDFEMKQHESDPELVLAQVKKETSVTYHSFSGGAVHVHERTRY